MLVLFSGNLLSAALEFSDTRQKVDLELGQEAITVKFPFHNSGEEAVRITSISSDCGCTAAMPSQRDYEPGEEGVIEVKFTVGNRSGVRVQRVFLQTDHAEKNRHTLELELRIPEEIEISQRVLQWRSGGEISAQSVGVRINENSPLRVKGARTDAANVEVTWIPDEESEGRRGQIQVLPLGVEESTDLRFRVDIVFDPESLADRSPPRVVVFGLVR